MEIIDTPAAMANALATYINPSLRRRLARYGKRLDEAGCGVGELGPLLVIVAGDQLEAIEQAAGIPIATNLVDGARFPDPAYVPSWEYCEADQGWYEVAYVTSDDGSGAVLLIPDRDGIDPTLIAIIRAFADVPASSAVK
ncbi:hypothetical protein HZY97_08440 [Sphingomonas sp. R-74633]|uniref:hypothetical protein n=1 Tax=Sphingomonas sp. R-74633 TaxID=2751188 RepID=UPI0015D39BAE|nr:hypothetical protein [Sphingomonas sp. R-74633]NYT40781.1 hypothetical protein [Sphingomonas sp. R-74633]